MGKIIDPAHPNDDLLAQRPREQATEAVARAIDHLYPGHGFMSVQRDDGSWQTIHFESATKLCGGTIEVKREPPESPPDMFCSKCGRITMNLTKPPDMGSAEELGRRIVVPGLPE